jgi:hypothetical protein
MKIKTLAITALIAAGFAFTSQSAKAALTYSAGDLFLGFQQTGNSVDYLVNLGSAAQFSQLNGQTFTVDLGGSIGADLSTPFTSTWYTKTNLFWSVTGTTFVDTNTPSTIFLTKGRSNVNTQTTPWTVNTPNGQLDQVGLFQSLASAYVNNGSATANSTKGTFQNIVTNPFSNNAYGTFTQGTSNDFLWGSSVEKNFSAGGASGSVLDLYKLVPDLNNSPAQYLGKFSIDNSGVVSFTSASAVPEPSTYGLIIVASLVIFTFARRRNSSTNS